MKGEEKGGKKSVSETGGECTDSLRWSWEELEGGEVRKQGD